MVRAAPSDCELPRRSRSDREVDALDTTRRLAFALANHETVGYPTNQASTYAWRHLCHRLAHSSFATGPHRWRFDLQIFRARGTGGVEANAVFHFRPHGFVLMDKLACGNPGPGGAAIATAVLRERQITAELDDWLPGHVLPALSRAKLLGHYRGTDASAPMTLTVALNRSDEAGFQRYLQDVYDQHSKSYRHFLTPRQISDRFGPSRREYGSVVSYLKRNRLAIVERYPNRMTVTVRGRRAHVERTFRVQISDYLLDGRREFGLQASAQQCERPGRLHLQWNSAGH